MSCLEPGQTMGASFNNPSTEKIEQVVGRENEFATQETTQTSKAQRSCNKCLVGHHSAR